MTAPTGDQAVSSHTLHLLRVAFLLHGIGSGVSGLQLAPVDLLV